MAEKTNEVSLRDRFLAAQRTMEGDHGDIPVPTNDAGEKPLDLSERSKDIGFGHKITEKETREGAIYGIPFIDPDGNYIPLTQEQKKTIQQKDMQKHLALARKNGWDSKLKKRGLSWDSLDEYYQLALQDLAYNVGGEEAGKTWENIFDAIENQDTEDFVRQLRRQDAGENTAGMDNRVAKVAYALGLISNLEEAHNAGLTLANTTEVPARITEVEDTKPIPIPKKKPGISIALLEELDNQTGAGSLGEGIETLEDSVPSVADLNAVREQRKDAPAEEEGGILDILLSWLGNKQVPGQEVATKAEGGFVERGPKLMGEPTYKSLATGLGTLGRYGDNYMVHASDGETVVPGEILAANPQLKNALFQQMQMMGVQDPNRYVVGNGLNSINPVTGQPEFFFKKLLSYALPIVGGYMAGPAGAGIGGFLGSKLSGAPTKDALMNALLAGGTTYAMHGIGNMDQQSGFWGGVKNTPLFGRMQGTLFPGGGTTSTGGVSAGTMDMYRNPVFSPAGRKWTPVKASEGSWTSGDGPGPYASRPTWVPPKDAVQKDGQWGRWGMGVRPEVALRPDDTGIAGWWNKRSGPQKLGLGVAGVAGLAGLADAFDEKKDDEDAIFENPELIAARKLAALPDERKFNPDGTLTNLAKRLQREAGIGPSIVDAEQLALIAGITKEEAQTFLSSKYGIVAAGGGAINGPGTGTSDDIPARLSDGEFVMTADAVRGAGNGNRQRGAARMYDMMHQFERVT